MRYVIIGHGVAGTTAADRIRALDEEGSITIFSEETEPFYYRIRLPEIIAGEAAMQDIQVHPEQWYREKRIEVKLGEKVVRVDTEKRLVVGDRGSEVEYDALLLATGAKSFVPPVKGVEKQYVYTLRNANDAKAIIDRADQEKQAILVGGGLLGLEAAYGLIRRGVSVQVVEIFDRLLPRQMCPTSASILAKKLEKMGFSFFLGVKAKEIFGNDSAEGLLLEDGRRLQGGFILFSAGVRPNLDLARETGLEIDSGLVVDDFLHTSLEGIWAAGDLVEHRDRVYGVWPAARQQGRIAGENMTGGKVKFEGLVMSNALKVAGVDLISAGEIDPEDKLNQAVFSNGEIFRKIVMRNGRIIGYIFLGTKLGLSECRKAMVDQVDVGNHAGHMGDGDFDFKQLSS